MRFILLLACVMVLLTSTGCFFRGDRDGGGGQGYSDHGDHGGDHGGHDDHGGDHDNH